MTVIHLNLWRQNWHLPAHYCLHASPNISLLILHALLTGTHASTSDTRKVSSFALEPEDTTEFRVKNKNENARSIKDGGDLDIKLNVINEEVKDKEVSDCEETHAVATVSAVAMGVLEETEEKAKGDSTEDHAGLAYAAFTTGVLSGNNTGSVIDSVC